MRTFITCLFALLLSAGNTIAQPALSWQRCIGGTGSEAAFGCSKATDGGFFVTGWTESGDFDMYGNHGSTDAFVTKLSPSGEVQWTKVLGGSAYDEGRGVLGTWDGGCIMVGSTSSTDGDVQGHQASEFTNSDIWVVKLDYLGNIQWQRCLGGTGYDHGNAIVTSMGQYYVAGTTSSTDGDVIGHHGATDAFVAVLDESGNTVWRRTFGSTGYDEGTTLAVLGFGDVVLGGKAGAGNGDVVGHHGGDDGWLVWLYPDWTPEDGLQRCLGGSGNDEVIALSAYLAGELDVACKTTSTDGDLTAAPGFGPWIARWNYENDAFQWHHRASFLFVLGVARRTDGQLLCTGTNGSGGKVIGLGTDGALQWEQVFGLGFTPAMPIGRPWTFPYALTAILDIDGTSLFTVGSAHTNTEQSSGHYAGSGSDAWAVKLGPGMVGVEEVTRPAFTLAPNPAREQTTLCLPPAIRADEVRLLDATGRCVLERSIANGPITLDLSGHENGVYVVQLRFADGSQAVERLVKE